MTLTTIIITVLALYSLLLTLAWLKSKRDHYVYRLSVGHQIQELLDEIKRFDAEQKEIMTKIKT